MFLRKLVIHSVKRDISVCSVLKEKFGYSADNANYLLDRFNDINNLPGSLIGIANKKKLESYIKQNGNLAGIEDLLQVHGLGAKTIRRMCDKLISIKGDPQSSEIIQKNSTKRYRLPIMTPALTESQASIIKTVGSVYLGVNQITWAKINCISKNLEAWELFDLDNYTALKKADLVTLIKLCKELVEQLPVCDTYILEDLNITNYGSNTSSVNGLPKNILTTITSTLIHQPPIGGVPKLVLVNSRAVAKWSGRLVGSEIISSQSIINDIIIQLNDQDSVSSGLSKGALPLLYAEPSLRDFYLASIPSSKEALADAVLLALSFIDLAINKKESFER